MCVSSLYSHLPAFKEILKLKDDTQNRLVALHSALIKTHEEADSPHSVIYRPEGSTMQLVTKEHNLSLSLSFTHYISLSVQIPPDLRRTQDIFSYARKRSAEWLCPQDKIYCVCVRRCKL